MRRSALVGVSTSGVNMRRVFCAHHETRGGSRFEFPATKRFIRVS